jgi:hypothetical protein
MHVRVSWLLQQLSCAHRRDWQAQARVPTSFARVLHSSSVSE